MLPGLFYISTIYCAMYRRTPMNEPTLKFPVTCPQCGNENFCEYPVAEVAVALLVRNTTFKLYAPCHNYHWNASSQEMKQIRQRLATAWADAPLQTGAVERERARS